MTQQMQDKFRRMNDRLNELSQLNGNIARLAFYINENDISDMVRDTLKAQRGAMIQYRDLLEDRIINGSY